MLAVAWTSVVSQADFLASYFNHTHGAQIIKWKMSKGAQSIDQMTSQLTRMAFFRASASCRKLSNSFILAR
jgi:hypothetical protein